MSNALSMINDSPEHLDMRRKELNEYHTVFAKQLGYIYSIMPMPRIMMNILTGEIERFDIDPKWQEIIDRIKQQHQQLVKSEFPEFYKQE